MYFFVVVDDGVEFVVFCFFIEIDCKFCQGIVVFFSVLISYFVVFMQVGDGSMQVVIGQV